MNPVPRDVRAFPDILATRGGDMARSEGWDGCTGWGLGGSMEGEHWLLPPRFP